MSLGQLTDTTSFAGAGEVWKLQGITIDNSQSELAIAWTAEGIKLNNSSGFFTIPATSQYIDTNQHTWFIAAKRGTLTPFSVDIYRDGTKCISDIACGSAATGTGIWINNRGTAVDPAEMRMTYFKLSVLPGGDSATPAAPTGLVLRPK